MSGKLFELGFNRNQQPVAREELAVTGSVPTWLNGSFIRNGPGLFYVGDQRFNHWFDGLAMLHKFEFGNGHVHYMSKFLECNASDQALNNSKLTYSEFATDPCWGLFGKVKSTVRSGPTDSAKVSLAKVGEQFYALGETTMQIEFDPDSLESLSRYNYNQPKFGTSSTAHPHLVDNGAINLITKYGPLNKYQVTQMNPAATRIASVNTLTPSYMHSFGMSQKYFIIAESPFTVQSIKLIAGTKPFIENFNWNSKRGTHIWVIDRETGRTVFKKEIEPFFFFHFVNSFDTDEGVSFDIVAYKDAEIISAYYLNRLESLDRPIPGGTLTRFTLDFSAKSANSAKLSDAAIELPHIDHGRYNMKGDYRYVYSPALASPSSRFYDQLAKIDVSTGEQTIWSEHGAYPGEPIFVASPGSAREDEGVILSLVLNEAFESSYLLILDAHTFEEIGRVTTPEPILIGFHGNYFGKN